MKKVIFTLSLLCALCACSSSDDDNRDMTRPVIVTEGYVAVPTDCQVFKIGETIPFNYIFTDDTELGSFNVEIHSNFDHHTHGTTIIDCPLDEKKKDKSSWQFTKDYSIPAGLRTYTARFNIPIPETITKKVKDAATGEEKDSIMPLQPGDYHFSIRLTDKAAWQELHALSIKIQ